MSIFLQLIHTDRPWSQDFQMTLSPEWEKDGLFEYVCEENNRCSGGHCDTKN